MQKTKILVAILILGLISLYAVKSIKKNGSFLPYNKQNTKKYQPETLKIVKREGRIKAYYPNGKLKSDKNYQNGILDGSFKIYYENGRVQSEGQYEHGQLDGLLKKYTEKGRLMGKEMYQDGQLIKAEKILK